MAQDLRPGPCLAKRPGMQSPAVGRAPDLGVVNSLGHNAGPCLYP